MSFALRPFVGEGGQITVSNNGGGEPVWSRTGQELFYRNGSQLMVVAVTAASTVSVGQPRLLFEGQFLNSEPRGYVPNYDVAADGQRFLMVAGEESQTPVGIPNLSIVLNWFEELRQRAPAR